MNSNASMSIVVITNFCKFHSLRCTAPGTVLINELAKAFHEFKVTSLLKHTSHNRYA